VEVTDAGDDAERQGDRSENERLVAGEDHRGRAEQTDESEGPKSSDAHTFGKVPLLPAALEADQQADRERHAEAGQHL
jgi:hypothetical protein